MFVIVGLGNPGREYAKTRHNVGFMTIDKIAERLNISVNKKGFRSVYGEGRLGGTRVVLAKPETFMNNSGWAVGDLLKWYKPQHDELIVIYDDIDLPCGALRIRMNGSAGTHNGMRSIESLIGFEDFPRIRVGIGKPAHGLIDHVLGVPNDEEAKLIDGAMMQAAEAAELIIAGKRRHSAKALAASYCVFNLTSMGPFFAIIVGKDAFLTAVSSYYGTEYAATLDALTPDWVVVVLIALALLGGLLGGLFGKRILNKHFIKAGIVA